MRKFDFSLEAVRTVRRHRLNLCEQLLSYVIGEANRLEREREQLQEERERQLKEIRVASEIGTVDVDFLAVRRYFAGRLMVDIARVDQQREIVDQQLQLCRQAIVRAEQELKVLDRLAEKGEIEHRRHWERIEQIEREETWQGIHQVMGGE